MVSFTAPSQSFTGAVLAALITILSVTIVANAQCPEPELILPCECVYDVEQGTDFFCGNVASSAELFQIFSHDFPTNELTRFWAWGSQLESLPTGVFGGKTFEDINIGNTSVSFIEPGLFASTEFSSRLLKLFASGAKISNFFELGILELMPNLEWLSLGSNGINKLPTRITGGQNLQVLFLDGNNIESIGPQVFSNMPNLTSLDLSGNSIAELTSNVFSPLPSLFQLYMGENGLERLQVDSLNFGSEVIDYVDLRGNKISSLEGALSGTFTSIRLDLSGNLISDLSESIYKPILDEFLGSYFGTIYLDENPSTCGCDMQWLLDNEDLDEELMLSYLPHIVGYCPDGTYFGDLVPGNFTDCAHKLEKLSFVVQ